MSALFKRWEFYLALATVVLTGLLAKEIIPPGKWRAVGELGMEVLALVGIMSGKPMVGGKPPVFDPLELPPPPKAGE